MAQYSEKRTARTLYTMRSDDLPPMVQTDLLVVFTYSNHRLRAGSYSSALSESVDPRNISSRFARVRSLAGGSNTPLDIDFVLSFESPVHRAQNQSQRAPGKSRYSKDSPTFLSQLRHAWRKMSK